MIGSGGGCSVVCGGGGSRLCCFLPWSLSEETVCSTANTSFGREVMVFHVSVSDEGVPTMISTVYVDNEKPCADSGVKLLPAVGALSANMFAQYATLVSMDQLQRPVIWGCPPSGFSGQFCYLEYAPRIWSPFKNRELIVMIMGSLIEKQEDELRETYTSAEGVTAA
ncbi:hypothetical protein M8C21_002639, partial [Ambrosia artemisiifolia]